MAAKRKTKLEILTSIINAIENLKIFCENKDVVYLPCDHEGFLKNNQSKVDGILYEKMKKEKGVAVIECLDKFFKKKVEFVNIENETAIKLIKELAEISKVEVDNITADNLLKSKVDEIVNKMVTNNKVKADENNATEKGQYAKFDYVNLEGCDAEGRNAEGKLPKVIGFTNMPKGVKKVVAKTGEELNNFKNAVKNNAAVENLDSVSTVELKPIPTVTLKQENDKTERNFSLANLHNALKGLSAKKEAEQTKNQNNVVSAEKVEQVEEQHKVYKPAPYAESFQTDAKQKPEDQKVSTKTTQTQKEKEVIEFQPAKNRTDKLAKSFFGLEMNSNGHYVIDFNIKKDNSKNLSLEFATKNSKCKKYAVKLSDVEKNMAEVYSSVLRTITKDIMYGTGSKENVLQLATIAKISSLVGNLQSTDAGVVENAIMQINNAQFGTSHEDKLITSMFMQTSKNWDEYANGEKFKNEYAYKNISTIFDDYATKEEQTEEIKKVLTKVFSEEFKHENYSKYLALNNQEIIERTLNNNSQQLGFVNNLDNVANSASSTKTGNQSAAGNNNSTASVSAAGVASENNASVADDTLENNADEGKAEEGKEENTVAATAEPKDNKKFRKSKKQETEKAQTEKTSKIVDNGTKYGKVDTTKSKKRGNFVNRHPALETVLIGVSAFIGITAVVAAVMALSMGVAPGLMGLVAGMVYNFSFAAGITGIGFAVLGVPTYLVGMKKRRYNNAYTKTVNRERSAQKSLDKIEKMQSQGWFKNRSLSVNEKNLEKMISELRKTRKNLTDNAEKMQNKIEKSYSALEEKRDVVQGRNNIFSKISYARLNRYIENPKRKDRNGSIYDEYYNYLSAREEFNSYVKELCHKNYENKDPKQLGLSSDIKQTINEAWRELNNPMFDEKFVHERTFRDKYIYRYGNQKIALDNGKDIIPTNDFKERQVEAVRTTEHTAVNSKKAKNENSEQTVENVFVGDAKGNFDKKTGNVYGGKPIEKDNVPPYGRSM